MSFSILRSLRALCRSRGITTVTRLSKGPDPVRPSIDRHRRGAEKNGKPDLLLTTNGYMYLQFYCFTVLQLKATEEV
jgi:hypothetical protein